MDGYRLSLVAATGALPEEVVGYVVVLRLEALRGLPTE